VKLPHLDTWTSQRQANAATYAELFARAGLDGQIVVPTDEPRGRHVWNQYVIRVREGHRDALRTYLRERGVASEIYYPVPLHLQECFRYVGCGEGALPVTEQAAHETLALPIFPELTADEQRTVVGRISEFFQLPPPPQAAQATGDRQEAGAGLQAPRFLRRLNAVGRADDVRC
jgi:dTDP-4-amino-4,6-dideoxygalactose transaminase